MSTSDNDFRLEDPPQLKRGPGSRVPAIQAFLDANVGQWARVAEYPARSSAHALASRLRGDGPYEVRVTCRKGEPARVYARRVEQ